MNTASLARLPIATTRSYNRRSSNVKCGGLGEKAGQRGQTSTAVKAEELRGQLQQFYVKQVETGDAHQIDRKSEVNEGGIPSGYRYSDQANAET